MLLRYKFGGKLSWALFLANILTPVRCQAVDEDKIDLSIMPGYQDLDSCVKCWIHDCWYGVANIAGCDTSGCLCRAGKMGAVLPVLSSRVLDNCKDLDDASMAVSFYTVYCATKGFTQIVAPTILQPTGAFTATTTETTTITAAVTTVTVYVKTSAADSPRYQPSWMWPPFFLGVAAIAVGAITSWAPSFL